MTMPLSKSNAHPFPIKVTEDQWQFLVRIPANQKERASRIAGRRWNPKIERWVYPKTLSTYEALSEEFKRDCLKFASRRPEDSPSLKANPKFAGWSPLPSQTRDLRPPKS